MRPSQSGNLPSTASTLGHGTARTTTGALAASAIVTALALLPSFDTIWFRLLGPRLLLRSTSCPALRRWTAKAWATSPAPRVPIFTIYLRFQPLPPHHCLVLLRMSRAQSTFEDATD